MVVVAVDTHSFVKRLVAAGMPEAQAEILAEERTLDLTQRLATKVDIEGLQAELGRHEAGLKAEIERLRAELGAEIERLRAELGAEIERLRAELGAETGRLRAELESRTSRLREELRSDIARGLAEQKSELLKWMFGAMVAQTGVIVALLRLL